MRLFELFDVPVDGITPIDGATARRRYGLLDIIVAYEFQANDRKFVTYFDNCGGGNTITMGFAFAHERDNHVSHKMTHDGNAVPVISYVVKIAKRFLEEYHPEILYFSGAEGRQSLFYLALLKRLMPQVPSAYKLYHGGGGYERHRIYLTRDPNFKTTGLNAF